MEDEKLKALHHPFDTQMNEDEQISTEHKRVENKLVYLLATSWCYIAAISRYLVG